MPKGYIQAILEEKEEKSKQDKKRVEMYLRVVRRQNEDEKNIYLNIIQKYMEGESGKREASKSISKLLDKYSPNDRDFYSNGLCRNITDEMKRNGYASRVDAFMEWYNVQTSGRQ